jgi:hypothetical protein
MKLISKADTEKVPEDESTAADERVHVDNIVAPAS